jgi:hypothetical protein
LSSRHRAASGPVPDATIVVGPLAARPATSLPATVQVAPDELVFRLAAGAVFSLLGERKMLFAQRQQKIFGLNDIAAYLACRLADGCRITDLADALVERGIGAEAAAGFVRHLFLTLSEQRLLRTRTALAAGAPVRVQHLEIAGAAAMLRYHDARLAERVAPIFAHLAARPTAIGLRYDLFRAGDFVLIRSGGEEEEAVVFAARQTAPALKGLLTDAILANAADAIVMHAACLGTGRGEGLLLLGAPGAGKSTLSLGLLQRGFAYGGDDIALLRPDGRVQGAPFALALKAGSWKLAEMLAPRIAKGPIYRRLDRKRVRYLSPESEAIAGPLSPRWVVLLRRRKEGAASLRAAEPVLALSEILGEACSSDQRLSAGQFATLARCLNAAQVHELTYSDLDGAADALTRLCEIA